MNLDSGRLVAINVETSECERETLADQEYIKSFFHTLISEIGMTPLVLPMAVEVPQSKTSINDPHADDGGLTVQCIISTSHIAYHSWPLQNRFRLVVDSCKDFSSLVVVNMVSKFFAVKNLSVQDIAYEPPANWSSYGEKRKQAATAVKGYQAAS